MKYRILSLLMVISAISIAKAQPYPIIIPSGQQLYFDLYNYANYPQNNYAIVMAPSNGTSWLVFTKPGGNIIIPDTVTYNGVKYAVTGIGPNAFIECNSVTSIFVPNTVTNIGNSAFWGCTALHTLTIGEGVKRMATNTSGSWSYSGIVANCTSLETIYYNADSCFMGCLFGFDQGNNIGLHTTVIIGDNVRYIGNNMFNKHNMSRSIESVVVGSSVATIGNNAFLNCSDITSITFRTQNPPMLGSGVFEGVNTDSVACFIPCGRTSYYFNQWSNLFNYTETSAGHSLNVASNYDSWGTAEIIQQPSCEGSAVIGATASCGYYFVRWSDGNMDNPRTITLQNDTYLTAIFASSYNVPDTVFVHDTTTINNYIHDTTYLPVYLHDTVPMIEYLHDTIYLPQYIQDTTIVNNYLIDTVYLPQYIHDTAFVLLHDTSYINVPVHDTTYITQTDTMTLIQYDTITYTIFDTLTVTDTLRLTQTDTLWLHDTIIVHDTIYITREGIDDMDALNAKVYSSHGQIVVEESNGNRVTLYDISGRIIATKQDYNTAINFDVPTSGTYMIKIGNHAVRKVVVIK